THWVSHVIQLIQRPTSSTLFPYTTLFRSRSALRATSGRPHIGLCTGGSGGSIHQHQRPGAGSRRHTGARKLVGLDTPARLYHHRSEEHTSELQSRENLVCRLLLEKKQTSN